MSYQINSSKLFLTYPQCSLPKEDVRDILIGLFPDCVKYIVAHEHHKNGDDHLHAYLEFPKGSPYRTRDPAFADLIVPGGMFHGNYQGCRSAKNVIKYVTKDDDYVSNFDISEITAKKSSKREVGEQLLLGKSLPKIIEEFPEYLIGYKKLKQDVAEYFRDIGDKRDSLPPFLPNPWGKVLPSHRNCKRRHYWIFSRGPNFGKTTGFAKPLFEEFKCVLQSGDFSYWNLRGDEEAVIIDEYNSPVLKYSTLNCMADGVFAYRVFHGGQVLVKNPLIIVLSNQSIVDLYPNMNNLLYARFIEIELK